MVEKAMEKYNPMKASGCALDKLTLTIMARNIKKAGREELTASVKRDFEEYVDDREESLEEVELPFNICREHHIIIPLLYKVVDILVRQEGILLEVLCGICLKVKLVCFCFRMVSYKKKTRTCLKTEPEA